MANPANKHSMTQRYAKLKAGGEVGSPHVWMTVYSDMMTNLMLFFLMMFALSMVGQTHMERAADAFRKTMEGVKVTVPVQQTPQDLKNFFKQFKQEQTNIEVIEQGEGVRLRLPEPVLFDPGQANLKADISPLLHEIAQGLRKFPNTIVIEGHTDNVPVRRGPFKSNWELSEARAESVLVYLFRTEGVPPHRMAVAGYGEFWPFAPNDTPENRAFNRRIEILVLNDEKN